MRNRYRPRIPRAAFLLTSIATTVITMGAMVVLPAKLEFVNVDGSTLAAAGVALRAIAAMSDDQCADESANDARLRLTDTHVRVTRVHSREQP